MTTIESLIGTWNLTTLDGASVADMLGPDMKAPNLEFAEDGRVSGFAGVNRVMSSVDLGALKRGEFALSPAATTMMAGPEAAMDLEQKFLSALHRATGIRIDGNRLDLTDAGASVLSFARGS
jgi:heat shock protein HslJ